jgi:SAM-dependent methyltransferase
MRAPSVRAIGPLADAVVWHEVECGSYGADLALWSELAAGARGRLLDLGCGTGRVGLHLARRGHEVTGLDLHAELVDAFNDRAAGIPARAVLGDARGFALAERFALALAPMQLLQLFESSAERIACMRCVAGHLCDGGRAAFALVEDVPPAGDAGPPLPDVREMDGWIYSSLPLDISVRTDGIAIRRLRQTVSPAGELREADDEVELRVLSAQQLEQEAEAAGLRPAGRLSVPPTEAHVGSTVVLLRRDS